MLNFPRYFDKHAVCTALICPKFKSYDKCKFLLEHDYILVYKDTYLKCMVYVCNRKIFNTSKSIDLQKFINDKRYKPLQRKRKLKEFMSLTAIYVY